MDNRRKRELEKRKIKLEQELGRLRKKLDKPVATIGNKAMQTKIVLYRNRVENNEYSFKLDEQVGIDSDVSRNLRTLGVQYILSVYSHGKSMYSPQVSRLGFLACDNFKKIFLKTQSEYIKHKDIIDREYAGFEKLEAELQEIRDELEEDEVTKASNERLRKMQRYFGDMGRDE